MIPMFGGEPIMIASGKYCSHYARFIGYDGFSSSGNAMIKVEVDDQVSGRHRYIRIKLSNIIQTSEGDFWK